MCGRLEVAEAETREDVKLATTIYVVLEVPGMLGDSAEIDVGPLIKKKVLPSTVWIHRIRDRPRTGGENGARRDGNGDAAPTREARRGDSRPHATARNRSH